MSVTMIKCKMSGCTYAAQPAPAFRGLCFKCWHLNADRERLKTAKDLEIASLQSRLATQSVQLEAALGACRAYLSLLDSNDPAHEIYGRLDKTTEAMRIATAMTPSQAAGIIAERDRLRLACELDDLCEQHRFGEIGNPEGSWKQRDALKDGCRDRGWDGKELVGEFIRRFRREALGQPRDPRAEKAEGEA